MGRTKVDLDLSEDQDQRKPVEVEETHELNRDEILDKIKKLEGYISRSKKRIKVHEAKLKKIRDKYILERLAVSGELKKIEGRILEVEI
jgi:hypothetical protein